LKGTIGSEGKEAVKIGGEKAMTSKNIEEIVFCVSSAEQLEAEARKLLREADYFRWRAARLIADEVATGTSQRELARQIGRSQTLVSFMVRVWQRFGDYPGNQRPTFQDAYRHVQQRRPTGLDSLVPAASDDDDTREAKVTMLQLLWLDSPFWKEYETLLKTASPQQQQDMKAAVRLLFGAIEAWLHGNKEECYRKQQELSELTDRFTAPTTYYHLSGSECLSGRKTSPVTKAQINRGEFKPCPHCYPPTKEDQAA
jgi:hypothetical protein